MIKTFISYSHSENQSQKEKLARIIDLHPNFKDDSVDTGDIDDSLDDEQIKIKIRDEYLKDTTVTIVLVGKNAQSRKHIDWEIASSMHDGKINSKSGIVVIDMYDVHNVMTNNDQIKKYFNVQWIEDVTNSEIKSIYKNYPERLIDNFINKKNNIDVIPYEKILKYNNLLFDSIELAHKDRKKRDYDLSRPLRKRNSDT